jgi:hypothetical protein
MSSFLPLHKELTNVYLQFSINITKTYCNYWCFPKPFILIMPPTIVLIHHLTQSKHR